METWVVVAFAVSWAIIVFLAWVVTTLVRDHGRSLVQQDELVTRLAATERALERLAERLGSDDNRAPAPQPPAGLPRGEIAPAFTLPDLDGSARTLHDFRGAPLLVVFFDVGCGFCLAMAPRLGALPADGTRVLLVSRGDREQHRALADEHGWRCDVVIEEGWEVATAYGTRATPTGYLLDADGRIASDLAVGADALLALLDGAAAGENKGARIGTRGVEESRIKRDGLTAGTPAPVFELPDLEGRTRSLTEFAGRQVLLVFSDPDCGPCNAIAPDLVDVHRRRNGLELVMVSRGDLAANQAKAAEYGYEFPVLLQRSWEVSKQYAMFATPIAYLIDEDGVIAQDVAVGGPAIVGLTAKNG